MSERNGDRSRFGRKRKQKILQRKRYRDLRKKLGLFKPLEKSDTIFVG